MQRAGSTEIGRALVILAVLGPSVGGRVVAQTGMAPASPSYAAAVKSIDTIRDGWQTAAPPEAPGWYSFFDDLRRDFDGYANAASWSDRLAALERIEGGAEKLAAASWWAPAAELRTALLEWVRPRLRLARAEKTLADALAGPGQGDEKNRKDWATFVDQQLGGPLRDYEAAKTVQARHEASERLHQALEALRKTASWPYAAQLQAAADDLFNAPNLDVSADVNALFPVLSRRSSRAGRSSGTATSRRSPPALTPDSGCWPATRASPSRTAST